MATCPRPLDSTTRLFFARLSAKSDEAYRDLIWATREAEQSTLNERRVMSYLAWQRLLRGSPKHASAA